MNLRLNFLMKGLSLVAKPNILKFTSLRKLPVFQSVFENIIRIPSIIFPPAPQNKTTAVENSILKVSTYRRKRTKLHKHKRKQRIKKIKRKSIRKRELKNI